VQPVSFNDPTQHNVDHSSVRIVTQQLAILIVQRARVRTAVVPHRAVGLGERIDLTGREHPTDTSLSAGINIDASIKQSRQLVDIPDAGGASQGWQRVQIVACQDHCR
jgi:hypothetical protein